MRANVKENKLLVPLEFDTIKRLFTWLTTNMGIPDRKRKRIDDIFTAAVSEESLTKGVTIAKETMQGYESALKWYYGQNKRSFVAKPKNDDDTITLDDWCNDFIKGYKKAVVKKKEEGIMEMGEGKAPISFVGFQKLNHKFLFNSISSDSAFLSFCYSSLQWNLMCRSINVEVVHFEHIDWRNDCLVVTFAKSKKDQQGSAIGKDKHVFANPLNAELCPILALALYVFTEPRCNYNNTKLFDGTEQKRRYANSLTNVLRQSTDSEFGCSVKNVGAVTHLCSTKDGSNPVAVYVRAG